MRFDFFDRLKDYFSYDSINRYALQVKKSFSLKSYVLTYIIEAAFIIFICRVYRLQVLYIALIVIIGLLFVPLLIKHNYKEMYNIRRFSDVDLYIHQMAYSFSRTPKINIALQDTYAISEGRLKSVIADAMDELAYGDGTDVYKDALNIIEQEYDCSRVRALHRFITEVERKGGKHSNSIRVLIEDFDRWVGSCYQNREELLKIKNDIIIGIIISMLLAIITSFMCTTLNVFSFGSVDITCSLLYQLSTAFFVILCIAFFVYSQIKYNYDFLKKTRSDKQILKDYNTAFNETIKARYIKLLPVLIVLGTAGIISALFKQYIFLIYIVISEVILVLHPFTSKKNAVNNVKNDIYEGFTEWLRNLALNLEDNPIQVAIENTYSNCPVILKSSLNNFLKEIEMDPSDIVPYYNFLNEFKAPDISAAVRTLYSISDLDKEEEQDTINVLVRRNYEIYEKAEKNSHINRTSLMRFSEYVPILLVSLKMGVDMMLVVTMYL